MMNESIKEVIQDIKEYVELRLEWFSLNTSEVISHWVVIILQKFFAISILLLALFFLMFALALYIGEVLGSDYYGYLIIGLIMLLVSFVFLSDTPRLLFDKMKYRMMSDVANKLNFSNQNPSEKMSKLEETGDTHS